MDVKFSLEYNCPSDFSHFTKNNQTFYSTLTLKWAEEPGDIQINFPVPIHGVFIIRSEHDTISSKRTWIPYLIDKPDEWLLKKYKENGTGDLLFRKAFPGGKYIQTQPGNEKPHKLGISSIPIISELNENQINLSFTDEKKTILKEFIKKSNSISTEYNDALDEQDIKHVRLQTFSTYIVERFISQLINCAMAVFRKDQRYKAILSSDESSINSVDRIALWDGIKERARMIGWQLIPTERLIASGQLELFSPLNNIDAISQLTCVKRYRYSKNLPAIYHQNHPSFKDIICPIETPESSDVGITLHLAQGVKTDIWGNLYHNPNPDSYLGYAASLVPFYQHNDAVRVMMGAKNLRQAVPLSGAEAPRITTGFEKDLCNAVKPLVDLKLVPDEFAKYEPGRELLVAYMPWYGYNFEDAIVANRDLVKQGQLTWTYTRQYAKYLLPDFHPNIKIGLNKLGSNVVDGDILATFQESRDIIPLVHSGNEGVLTDLRYLKPSANFAGGTVQWSIKYDIPLQVGSKLMARYGNKGVISKFYPAEELPRFPDDSHLPANLRGKAVDLVLNPHGVISRMNLGQLMETQYTLASHLGFKLESDIGNPFNQHDHLKLNDFFKSTPLFDKYGRIQLEFGTNQLTESPVAVGFQHFSVLKHIPSKKAHARRGRHDSDRYNRITGQPVGGKANKGGQRLGEMEFWALAAHQADDIINEFLTHRSEPAWNSSEQITQTSQAIFDHLFALGFNVDKKSQIQAVIDDDVLNLAKPVRNKSTRIVANKASFACPKCGKKLFDGLAIVSTANTQRSSEIVVDINSVLQQFDYQLEDVQDITFNKPGKDFKPKNEIIELSSDKGPLHLELEFKQSTITIRMNVKDEVLIAKCRYDKDFKLTEFPSIILNCSKHTSERLVGSNPILMAQSVSGGFYDPTIFGNDGIKKPDLKWGFIELPEKIPHPFIKDLKIRFIPVLPVKYRSTSSAIFLKKREEHDLTDAYVNLYDAVQGLNSGKVDNQELLFAVGGLYNKIKVRTFGKSGKSKFGLLRRHGLGRRVDYSSRLVIVPDPSLDWDEVSIPVNVLSVLYGDQIAESGIAKELNKFFSKYRDISTPIPDEVEVYDVVKKYLEMNETRVLLNRAPSLHKYNILSFKPTTHLISDGQVFKLNPIVFKGFGADADGDEMTIHALLDDASLVEAKRLSPSHPENILSVASDEPMFDFDQDFVLGNYLHTKETKSVGLTRYLNLIKSEHNYKDIILNEMRSAFEKVTVAGVSFSYLELLECAIDEKEIFEALQKDEFTINPELEKLTHTKLYEIIENSSNPGYYFAAMALSGARGTKQTRQVLSARGFLHPGSTGFNTQNHDFVVFDSLLKGMDSNSSFMSTFNARSSMIDKNIGTYKAGFFMRKLVLALWPWHVKHGDCGKKSIIECDFKTQKCICSGCYGIDEENMYPAGLIAAQSIGERCTQLTMSSFHSGEKGVSLSDVEGILSKLPSNFDLYCQAMHEIPALNNIKMNHFCVLWLAILTSEGKSLNSAIKSGYSPLSSTVGISGFRNLIKVIEEKSSEYMVSNSIQRLMMSCWEEA